MTMPLARLERVFCRARDTARPATLNTAMMEVTGTLMELRTMTVSSAHSRMRTAERI